MSPPFATPRARALGFGIKQARLSRKLGVRELARLTLLSPQEISNWERGKRVPKIEEVATILGALRVEPVERERLFDLARNANELNWLAPAPFVEYERAATSMVEWASGLIPGLLQAPSYIRAIFAATACPKSEIEKHIMTRLARREVLTGHTALPYRVLIGETALRHNIGGPAVMAEQLGHLLAMSRLRNVSARIVPSESGYHPGLYGPFVIFDFADLPSIVHLELYRGSGYSYDEHHLADYRAAVETLSALALSERVSEQLIQGVITELEA
jgi:transcriptional regulator with XRE-family HTH domain